MFNASRNEASKSLYDTQDSVVCWMKILVYTVQFLHSLGNTAFTKLALF